MIWAYASLVITRIVGDRITLPDGDQRLVARYEGGRIVKEWWDNAAPGLRENEWNSYYEAFERWADALVVEPFVDGNGASRGLRYRLSESISLDVPDGVDRRSVLLPFYGARVREPPGTYIDPPIVTEQSVQVVNGWLATMCLPDQDPVEVLVAADTTSIGDFELQAMNYLGDDGWRLSLVEDFQYALGGQPGVHSSRRFLFERFSEDTGNRR